MAFDSGIQEYASLFYAVEEGQEAPSMGDGVTYSRALGWQSPEGNWYGQTRWVRDWPAAAVWNGVKYLPLAADGEAESISGFPIPTQTNPNTGLPYGTRQDFEIWSIPRPNWPPEDLEIYDGRDKEFYFWDSDAEDWLLVEWFYTVDNDDELPTPGIKKGAAHLIMYIDMMVFWDGYVWRRLRHEMLDIGEHDTLHLPEGFIQYLAPDVELVYTTRKQLSLIPRTGGLGYVIINGENVYASGTCSLFSSLPALTFTGNNVVPQHVMRDTEYWVYLANSKSSIFSVAALEATNDYNATIAWDFRGKLFLSATEPVDGVLGIGLGRNAVLVGRISTDATLKADGGPFFRHELDISSISQTPQIIETWRDYSDYYLEYASPSELQLKRQDGSFGMLYIPQELICFGEGQTVLRTDPWLSIDPLTYEPSYQSGALSTGSRYYLYVLNDIDAVNFNETNANTGRPWDIKDSNADVNYVAEKDFRRKLVLSDKEHEHYRLTETSPLFFSRCVGYIDTDANGYFIYSKDGSYIKAMTINPVHLKGLADLAFYPVNDTSFKVAAKDATAGIIYVGGQDVKVFSKTSSLVHTPRNTDYVQTYIEENFFLVPSEAPLVPLDQVVSYKSTTLYLYMANYDSYWGYLSGSTVFSLQAPVDGYISANYPGNGLRWIATVKTDSSGKFTGSWLLDSTGDMTAVYGTLADTVNEIADHTSLIDFLMGWNSNYDLGLDPYISNLWSDYSDLATDISGMWEVYSDMGSTISAIDGVVDSLSNEFSGLQSDFMVMDSLVGIVSNYTQSLGSETSKLGSNIDALSGNLSDMGSDIGNIFSDIALISGVTSELGSNVTDLQVGLSNLASTADALESNIDAMGSNISDLWGTQGSLSVAVSGMGSDISTLSNIASNIQSDVSALGIDVENFYSLQGLFDSNLSDLWGTHGSLSQVVSGMGSDLITLSNINSNIQSDVSALGQDVTNLYSVQDMLGSNLSNLWGTHGSLSQVVAGMGSDLITLSNINSNIQSDVSALGQDVANFNSLQSLMDSNLSDLWGTQNSLSVVVSGIGSNLIVMSNIELGIQSDVAAIDSYVNVLSSLQSLADSNLSDLWGTQNSLSVAVSGMGAALNAIPDLESNVSALGNDVDNFYSFQSLFNSNVWELLSDAAALGSLTEQLGSQLSIATEGLSLLSGLEDDIASYEARLESDYSYINGVYSLLQVNLTTLIEEQQTLADLHFWLEIIHSNLDSDYQVLSGIQSQMADNVISFNSDMSNIRETFSDVWSNYSDIYTWVGSLSVIQSGISGEVSGLGSNLVNLSGHFSNLVSDIDTLASNTSLDFSSVYSDINDISGDISNIWSDWSGLSDYTDSLYSATSGLQSATSALGSNLTVLSGNVDALNSDIMVETSLVASLSGQLDILNSDINLQASLLGSLSNADASLASSIATQASLQNNLSLGLNSLITDLSGQRNNIINLSNTTLTLGSNINSVSNTASLLGSATSNLNSNLLITSGLVNSLSTYTSTLSGNLSSLSQNATSLSGTLSLLGSGYLVTSGLTNTLSNNLSTASNIANSLASYTSLLSGSVSNLSLNTGSLSNTLSLLNSGYTLTSGLVNTLSTNLSTTLNIANSLAIYTSTLSGNVSNLSLNTNSLSVTLSLIGGKYSSTSGLVNTLSTNLTAASNTANSLASYTSTLSGNVSNLSLNAGSLGATLSSLGSGYLVTSGLTNTLSTNLSVTSNLVNSLSAYTTSLSGNVSRLSLNAGSLGTTLSSLGSGYLVTSGLTNTLSTNLVSLNSNYSNTVSNVAALDAEIDYVTMKANAISANVSTLSGYTTQLSGHTNNLSLNLLSAQSNVSNLYSNYSVISGIYLGLSGTTVSMQTVMSDVSGRLVTVSGLLNSLDSLTDDLESEAGVLSGWITSAQGHISNLSGDIFSLDSHIDDIENGLESGYIGTIPVLITYDWIGKRFKFEDQKGVGIPCRLEYRNTTSVNIVPTEPTTQIVFPNASVVNLQSTSYINLSACTTPGTIYYLYLKMGSTGGVLNLNGGAVSASNYYFSTSAPTSIYQYLGTRSTTGADLHDSILLGYVSCVSSNTLQGAWNVWSLSREISRQWVENYSGIPLSNIFSNIVKPYNGSSSSSAELTRVLSYSIRAGTHFRYYTSFTGQWWEYTRSYTTYNTLPGTYNGDKYLYVSHNSPGYYEYVTYGNYCGGGLSTPCIGRTQLTIPSIAAWDDSLNVVPSISFGPTALVTNTTVPFAGCNSYFINETVNAVIEGTGSVTLTRNPPSNAVFI
jgi:archaellum component FlaC